MEAIDALKEAGLSEYEAKAYFALLKYGRQTGKELSDRSGVPPTRVFDVLRQLLDKGLAELIEQNPMLWSAIKPELGLKSMIERRITGYTELEKTLLKSLKSVKQAPEKAVSEEVTVISGFNQIFFAIAEKVKAVTKNMCVYSIGEAIPSYAEIEHARAVRRGVNLRMITTTHTDENKALLKKWQKDGWLIRYLPGSKEYTFAVFDKSACMIIIKNLLVKDERMLIQFENPDLSAALYDYYDVLWKRAKPVKA